MSLFTATVRAGKREAINVSTPNKNILSDIVQLKNESLPGIDSTLAQFPKVAF